MAFLTKEITKVVIASYEITDFYKTMVGKWQGGQSSDKALNTNLKTITVSYF